MKSIESLLKDYGANIVARMVKILELNNKIATGRLITSIDYIVKKEGEGKEVLSILMEYYGQFVNDGRKPGKGIPINALNAWLDQKGINRKYGYIINRKIKMEGIKAVPFIDQAISQIEYEFSRDLEQKWGDEYGKELYSILKNRLETT